MTQLDLLEGERRREEGIGRVAGNSDEFLRRMRFFAKLFLIKHGQITTDDLREYANSNGIVPHHPNAWGAVFRGKNWKCIGRQKSEWPPNHAREIKVWKWEG